MKFFEKQFHFYIFFCKTIDKKIYDWKIWREVFPYLDKLLKLTDFPATIHSYQSSSTIGNKYLPFGRMIWNFSNNEKWTTKYKVGKDAVAGWEFYDTEIWTPPKSECFKKEYFAPNIYIKVDDDSTYDTAKYFDASLLLAIDNDTYDKIDAESLNIILNNICEISNTIRLAKTVRPWAIDLGYSVYGECIQDESAGRYLKSDANFEMTNKYNWEIIKQA